jgi:ribosome maturation factor RimP
LAKKTVSKLVEDILLPFLQDKPYELVEVSFVKEGPHRYLRVTIDKEEGVSLDDCQLVSEFLSKELDRRDPIEENYFLEVESPGVERPLKKESDFEKFKGQRIEVKLYQTLNGQKVIQGILEDYKDEAIIVRGDISQSLITIPHKKAASVKLMVDFS